MDEPTRLPAIHVYDSVTAREGDGRSPPFASVACDSAFADRPGLATRQPKRARILRKKCANSEPLDRRRLDVGRW